MAPIRIDERHAIPGDGPAPPSYSEQVIRGLTSGVIAVDSEGRIISVNPAARRFLNMAPESLQAGAPFRDVEGLRPFVDILTELTRTGESIFRREVLLDADAVGKKEIGVSASLLEGPDEYNGAILLFTDMTERRKLERDTEASRKLAALGELAAGVVHELRNPLTIIGGRAELMLRRMAEDDRDRASIEEILFETRELNKTISQFMGFAKPFGLQPDPCSAGDIAERALRLCRKRADEKGVSLISALENVPEEMHVDKVRVAEALSNIVSNAVDAVDQGGHVTLAARQDGNTTVFEITDDGPGIHLEPGEDLFSPFFTQKRDGTGLGLSIVQRIVLAQGGSVSHGNRSEGGARFEVRIPTVQGRRP